MQEENKQNEKENALGQRVFGVVLKGHPGDFQLWLDSAKSYGLYIIFSKSTRVGKLLITEECW